MNLTYRLNVNSIQNIGLPEYYSDSLLNVYLYSPKNTTDLFRRLENRIKAYFRLRSNLHSA